MWPFRWEGTLGVAVEDVLCEHREVLSDLCVKLSPPRSRRHSAENTETEWAFTIAMTVAFSNGGIAQGALEDDLCELREVLGDLCVKLSPRRSPEKLRRERSRRTAFIDNSWSGAFWYGTRVFGFLCQRYIEEHGCNGIERLANGTTHFCDDGCIRGTTKNT